MLEQWKQENLELRGHIRVLTRRLEQAGEYVDVTSSRPQDTRKGYLRLMNSRLANAFFRE